jgi:hypothetical protein
MSELHSTSGFDVRTDSGPAPDLSPVAGASSPVHAEPEDRERRRHPRYTCEGYAEVVLPSGGLRFRGKILNLSISGCFVETEFRLERGTVVEVYFEMRRLCFRVAGTAAAPQKKRGVGIAFQHLTLRRMREIEEILAELHEIREDLSAYPSCP